MEYLSKDILDESFIKSFAPFHWFQMVLGSCRVDVRDSFATTPTVRQKLYSAVLIMLSSAAYVSFVFFYSSILRGSVILLYILLAILGLHNLVNICNIFHVRFVNNDQNVQFLIRLHEIDKSMGIDRKAYIHDVFYNVNLVTVVVWFLFPTGLFLFTLASDWLEGVCYICIYYSQITCAFEWMYFSNLIVYFYIRLRYINSIMINHLGIEDSSYLKMYKFITFMHKTILKDLAAETSDFASSDMVLYLNQIFDALTQFTSLYRFQMFFCCVKFIIVSVLAVEFYLLVLQMNVNLGIDRFIGPIIWVGDFVILGVICLRWDDFFFELRETKNLATKILATHTSGPLRKRASMMIKLIEESSPHFSVYDMWNVDASTLLNMLGVLTTLTVTQMQFALL